MALLLVTSLIFYNKMKQIFVSILLFCSISNYSYAEVYENFNYTESKGEITINSYIIANSSETDIVVPKFINEKEVTKIKKILGNNSEYNVERMFFPPSVSTVLDNNTNVNLHFLKCAVFDNDFKISNAAFPLYYYDTEAERNTLLKSVFLFGAYKYKAQDITGNHCDYLFHLGSILVKYSDFTTEEIQMYNWDSQNIQSRALVDQTRFEYLIWALEQHLVYKDYSLADIKEIDLTNLQNKPSANTEVNIDFGNYDPSSALNYGAKVIVSSNKEYEHTLKDNEIISITDLQDYTLPFIDTNTTIHYTRSNTKDWNSVCLPFVLHESDFPEDSNTKIYTISGADEERIKLTHVESVAAGEPCFICSKAENWNLSLTDREIKSTTQAGITEIEGWKMYGSFKEAVIGAGKFKLDSDGSSIGQTATDGACVYPFRCYLECTLPNGAPERFMVDIEGEEQSITLTEKDDEVSDTFYIDLSGRRIQNTSEPRLIKGRNIIIR